MILPTLSILGFVAFSSVNGVQLNRPDDAVYPCYPPLQQLLLNKDDIASEPVWNGIRNWSNIFFQNMTDSLTSVDSASVLAFGPDGEAFYENYFGLARGNESSNDQEQKLGSDSIYRVASVTKLFTALEILHLRDIGALNLDKDITHYVPEFAYTAKTWKQELGLKAESEPRKNKRIITTRHILGHLSGLVRDVFLDQQYPLFNPNLTEFLIPQNKKEVLSTVNNHPPLNLPQAYPTYSNIGFIIAGYIIEGAEAKRRTSSNNNNKDNMMKYEDIIARDILEPLGMDSTFFSVPQDKRQNLVVSSTFSNWTDYEFPAANAAFGLYSTPTDMKKFTKFLLKGYYEPESTLDIVRSESIREWLRPNYGFDDSLFGVGHPWEIFTYSYENIHGDPNNRPLSVYTKSGTLPGHHTYVIVDPARQFGLLLFFSGDPLDLLYYLEQVVTKFGAAVDEARTGYLEQDVGTYCLVHDELNATDVSSSSTSTSSSGSLPIGQRQEASASESSSIVRIEERYGSLWVSEWQYRDVQMLSTFNYNAIIGNDHPNVLGLWPSSEDSVYYLGIGRPPNDHYEGCSMKFVNMAHIYGNGVPSELVVLENGLLTVPGAGQVYQKC